MSAMFSSRRTVLKSALGLAASAALPMGALAKDAAKAVATALSDRLLLVSGLGGNIVALRSDAGVLLVDSGSPGATSKLQAELKRFAPGAKVTTVINTHWHTDQTGGNEVFAKGGAKIIAHAKAAQRMAVDQYVPWEDRYLKARSREAVPTEVIYTGSRELTFGGEHIEYGYLFQAHTDGDIYVHFRNANVLVVGDVLAVGRYPIMDYCTGGWIGGTVTAAQALAARSEAATKIIPGTGAVQGRAQLEAEYAMLNDLKLRLSKLLAQGMSVEDMIQAAPTHDYDTTWGDPQLFIRTVWPGLVARARELGVSIV